MYRPRHYDIDDPATLATFMREHGFVLLVTTVDGAPFATHLPLLLTLMAERMAGCSGMSPRPTRIGGLSTANPRR